MLMRITLIDFFVGFLEVISMTELRVLYDRLSCGIVKGHRNGCHYCIQIIGVNCAVSRVPAGIGRSFS